MLFKYSVLLDPTLKQKLKGARKQKAGGPKEEDGSLASCVWAMLVAAGIHIKMITPPKPDINAYYHSVKKHSFAGADASILMTVWKPILDLVFPADVRSKNPDTQKKYVGFVNC